MKKKLFLFPMLLLFAATACKQKPSPATPVPVPYKLYVQLGKISSTDLCQTKNQAYYKATAKLVNTSNIALKYTDWTCSHAVWSTNDSTVEIYEDNEPCSICEKNILGVYEVPPHSTKTMMLAINSRNRKFSSGQRVRIGITLINPDIDGAWGYNPNEFDRLIAKNNEYRIWSGEVIIP